MMLNINQPKTLLTYLFLVICVASYAQRENDTIRPERLIITKQYNPTVNDAFKIRSKPTVDSEENAAEKEIEYNLLTVPVASTFTPQKGRAAQIKKINKHDSLFPNYARFGLGNYTSVLGEFYGNVKFNKKQNLGVDFFHYSSQGGIDEVALDDDFYTTRLGLNFESKEKTLVWNIKSGLKHQIMNFYGLPETPEFTEQEMQNIDSGQSYFTFKLGGGIDFYEGVFNKVNINFQTFSDSFSSSENRFEIYPELDIDLAGQLFNLKFSGDYLSGTFKQQLYQPGNDINYSYFIGGFNPNLLIDEDRFSIDLGAEVAYLNDSENSESDVFLYPKIKGSYRINQDNLIAYGGFDGGLDQNSYAGFVAENPFVSPTLNIAPSNRQYDAFLGVKGGSFGVSYNAKLSYVSTENRALFTQNQRVNNSTASPTEGYEYGNSFGVIYDDINRFSFDFELDYDVNSELNLGFTFNYSSFDTDNEEEAWNLPELYTSLNGTYQITDKWSVGTSIFYVGERKDQYVYDIGGANFNSETQTIDSFIDFNLEVNYRINKQLSAFATGRNLLGGNYQRWNNYVVQDLQIMGGVSYQFDW
ncbi:MAG: TonB-dependent receptor [Bacteroidota bacterium]